MFGKIKKLLTHSVVYGLGNSANRVVGFFLLPVYSRYLSPEDYGVLALVGMFGEILFILTGLGQSSAIFRTYFQHDDPQARETVITTSLWIILTLSFPIGLVAIACAQPLSQLITGSPEYAFWVRLSAGAVMFRTLERMPLAVLRAREESRRYASSSFIKTAIGLVLAIVFVVGLQFGGRGVLLSQLIVETAMCAYLLPLALKGLAVRYSSADARHMLGYGLYLIPTALGSFVLQLSDRYFLKYYSTLSVVGIYALGNRLGEMLSFPMHAFELAWPQFLFGNQKNPDAPALYARVFTYLLTVLGFLWLTISLLAQEIVTVMVHPAFYEAYRVVPWIAGAFLAQSLNYAGNVGINLQRKVKYRPLILAMTAALNLTLNFLLIPAYGMIGAAIATFASYAFQSLFRVIVSYWLYPVPYEYARLARLAVIIASLYSAGVWIAWNSIWTALAGKVGLVLLFPICLYVSRFFESGELRHLRELMTRLKQKAGLSSQASRALSEENP
ncbi:MAG: oligosaccharide flippase family protein [Deltaproteobacteria bacterium]|nr:oligosaccharide flippase family protein [Deltaproteobacteria bacterium]